MTINDTEARRLLIAMEDVLKLWEAGDVVPRSLFDSHHVREAFSSLWVAFHHLNAKKLKGEL